MVCYSDIRWCVAHLPILGVHSMIHDPSSPVTPVSSRRVLCPACAQRCGWTLPRWYELPIDHWPLKAIAVQGIVVWSWCLEDFPCGFVVPERRPYWDGSIDWSPHAKVRQSKFTAICQGKPSCLTSEGFVSWWGLSYSEYLDCMGRGRAGVPSGATPLPGLSVKPPICGKIPVEPTPSIHTASSSGLPLCSPYPVGHPGEPWTTESGWKDKWLGVVFTFGLEWKMVITHSLVLLVVWSGFYLSFFFLGGVGVEGVFRPDRSKGSNYNHL